MTKRAKIKIIKKKEIHKKGNREKVIEMKLTKESKRKMFRTVSDWVSDFQQKRQRESKKALENLFTKLPQTDGI